MFFKVHVSVSDSLDSTMKAEVIHILSASQLPILLSLEFCCLLVLLCNIYFFSKIITARVPKGSFYTLERDFFPRLQCFFWSSVELTCIPSLAELFLWVPCRWLGQTSSR